MLLSCGDALIDFLPVKSVDGRDAAVPVAGGSCLNVAVGIARLGAAAGFVGGISTDLFGRMIADHALASQVDLRYAVRSGHQTTLAFVRTVAGEPQYAFYDEATASRNWIYRRESIAFDQIEAIHLGSTTLVNDEGAAQARALIDDADVSVTISFDPNCRPALVRHKARYVDQMDAFAAAANIVRMSDADFEFLYGGNDYAGRAKSLIEAGASLEEICGILFWKIKDMLLRKNFSKFSERELKDMAARVSYLLPQARKRGMDAESALEQFLLEAF